MDSPAKKTFDTRDLHVHGSIVNPIILVRASHQVPIPIVGKSEEGKRRKDLYQWIMSNHISKHDTTL